IFSDLFHTLKVKEYKNCVLTKLATPFHHGERKSEELISNALEVGLFQDKGLINNRTGEKGYSIFANKCIAFPLKNKENQIVSFYFRAIVES
ncbi:hypothetical protein ABS765_10560, partial [Chryseobacterium sp. ST-37]